MRKVREGERLLNDGKDLAEVLRHLEIAESTWNRWRNQLSMAKLQSPLVATESPRPSG